MLEVRAGNVVLEILEGFQRCAQTDVFGGCDWSIDSLAKANKVDPYWYLRALFEQLPTFDPNDDHDELLPWNINSRKPEGF